MHNLNYVAKLFCFSSYEIRKFYKFLGTKNSDFALVIHDFNTTLTYFHVSAVIVSKKFVQDMALT